MANPPAPSRPALTLRDPVHGFIHADALEAALVETAPLQRLRHVRQLGMTHLVFPGAEHSRFSHALGAMELAGRVYDALAARDPERLPPGPRARERRLLRAAALVHDVGHAPFSHSAEECFEEGLDHEAMTRRLLALPQVEAAFEAHGDGLEPAEVAALLEGGGEGTERLLHRVVAGELDVDKMDYLLRDGLFCGVRYGSYDLDRLLTTVLPVVDPADGEVGVGVEEGGVHALEALVLARYYMFTQVYFNVTGKALELHLAEWLREVGHRWPADPEAFLAEDDVELLARMRRSPSRHARAVVHRDHYPLAFETREHLGAGERERFEALVPELHRRFGPAHVLVSHSAKDPHRMGAARVMVRRHDGGVEPMEEASHFIRHLTRIERFRVYARRRVVEEVREWLGRRWEAETAAVEGGEMGSAVD